MSSSKNMNLTPIVFMIGLLVVSLFDTCSCAITCEEGLAQILPCVGYLVGRDPNVSAPCCQGASKLKDLATTKPDIRTLCFCFKDAVTKFHVDVGRAKSLPDTCHITVPVPIDPNVDCNKIVV